MSENIGRYRDPQLATLIGKLLGTFDSSAREALTRSLAEVARANPKAVAEQLKVSGSFQQLAIASALKTAGDEALPLVAQQLAVADARPNAVAFLVGAGEKAAEAALPYLADKDKDVRLAAADALGKLRSRAAVPRLVELYNTSTGDEKLGYLSALSGIGDPETEGMMRGVLNQESLSIPERSQAALGLGRIGTLTAVADLWRYSADEHRQLRQSVVSALQVAGDVALKSSVLNGSQLLAVAQGIDSALATNIIAARLKQPASRPAAARAAWNRPSLSTPLFEALETLDADNQGDVADELIRALASTQEGRERLRAVTNPELQGLVQRRLRLSRLDAT